MLESASRGVSAWSGGWCLPGLGGVCLVGGGVSAWSRGGRCLPGLGGRGGSAWSGRGCLVWGGVCLVWGVPGLGVCVPGPGGGLASQHALRQTHPPHRGQTDTCKNITLATTSLRLVTILHFSRMCTACFNGHLKGGVWANTPLGRHPPSRQTPPSQCMLGYTPSPVDRILDTRFWKHYLPATSFVGGKNTLDMSEVLLRRPPLLCRHWTIVLWVFYTSS